MIVNIQFSKPLYAMIKLQKFNPPPSFPALSLSVKEREMYSLGIKLTCAFELLASSTSPWSTRLLSLWNVEKERKIDDIVIKQWEENCEEVDGEEWMTLSGEDVKNIMSEDKSEEEQVREMIANMGQFMEGESGFEGIDVDEYVSFLVTRADCRFEFDSDDDILEDEVD